jgi:hypothetical protein
MVQIEQAKMLRKQSFATIFTSTHRAGISPCAEPTLPVLASPPIGAKRHGDRDIATRLRETCDPTDEPYCQSGSGRNVSQPARGDPLCKAVKAANSRRQLHEGIAENALKG